MLVETVNYEKLGLGTKMGLKQLNWGGDWTASVAALRAAYRSATARYGKSKVEITSKYGTTIKVRFRLPKGVEYGNIGCCFFDEKTFKLIMRTVGARRKSTKKALAAKAGR